MKQKIESPEKAKKLLIISGGIGMGLMLLATYMAVSIRWVISGLTGEPRIIVPYAEPIVFLFIIAATVLIFTWLFYAGWASEYRKANGPGSIESIKRRMRIRLVYGLISFILFIGTLLVSNHMIQNYDIGGYELVDSEEWRPFFFLMGTFFMLGLVFILSAVSLWNESDKMTSGASNG